MVLLTDLSILEIAFSDSRCENNRILNKILFNNQIQVCLNKNLINEFENLLEETEYFQAFIRELYDNDRIVIEKSSANLSFKEQFKEIAINSKISFLIPITLSNVEEYIKEIENLIIVDQAEKVNKHWIAIELLTNNLCNVSFADFKNDIEINTFFENIFKLPKFIKQVKIFNRDQDHKYLTKIKGCNIDYYTLMNGSNANRHLRNETKRYIQKELGGKLKLLYTSNRRIIHERKIIFDNLIVTLDNSLENITINEPTWEIYLNYDKEKASKWVSKCGQFIPI